MMKKVIFLFVLCLISFKGLTQKIVVDPFLSLSYTTWKNEDNKHKEEITNNQRMICYRQDVINQRLVDLKKIEQRNLDYLVEKQDSAVDIEEYAYFSALFTDIGRYYKKSHEVAKGNPELMKVVEDMRIKLVIRSSKILNAIAQFAKKDGKSNLLNNNERNQLIIAIIMELREMKQNTHQLYDVLKTAQKSELAKRSPYDFIRQLEQEQEQKQKQNKQ